MASPVRKLGERVNSLNAKRSAALAESKIKDDLVKQHAQLAEEALAGWEKAEAECVALKKLLDAAHRQKLDAEVHSSKLSQELKDCIRQLKHFQKAKTELEEKLRKTNIQLLELSAENASLHKSIQEKTSAIEQLEKISSSEGTIRMLKEKSTSLEKENGTLQCKLHILNKGLESCQAKREYDTRTADAAIEKQISMEKITEIEKEGQRFLELGLGSDSLPKGSDQMKLKMETWTSSMQNAREETGKGDTLSSLDRIPLQDISKDERRQTKVPAEHSLSITEGNKLQKRTINAKTCEPNLKGIMPVRQTCQLLQDGKKCECQDCKDDDIGCAQSWACALISELARLKNNDSAAERDYKTNLVNFSLMNDFAEMEEFVAISTVKDDNSDSYHKELDKKLTRPVKLEQSFDVSLATASSSSQEQMHPLIPNSEETTDCSFSICFQGLSRDNFSSNQSSHSCSRGSEVTVASSVVRTQVSELDFELNALIVNLLTLLKDFRNSSHEGHMNSDDMPENILGYHLQGKSVDVAEHSIYVLVGKNSDFFSNIQGLYNACCDLQKNAGIKEVTKMFASAVVWFLKHLFTIKEASKMNIKGIFKCEERLPHHRCINSMEFEKEKDIHVDRPENESETLITISSMVGTKANGSTEQISGQLKYAQDLLTEGEFVKCELNGEIFRLKNEVSCLKLEREDLEERLHQASANIDCLQFQVQECEERISKLQLELSMVRGGGEFIGNESELEPFQTEKQTSDSKGVADEKIMPQDRNSILEQKLKEQQKSSRGVQGRVLCVQQQLSSAEMNSRDLELEGAQHMQDMQGTDNKELLELKKEKEIAVATAKLEECHQTILALGKQLKVLASPFNSPGRILSDRSPGHEEDLLGPNSHSIQDSQIVVNERKRTGDADPEGGDKEKRDYSAEANGESSRMFCEDQIPRGSSLQSILDSEKNENQIIARNSQEEKFLSSPSRSPMRLLSINRKVSRNDKIPATNGQCSSGLSRFFTRNKSS